MSFGFGGYGLSPYGGNDFDIEDHYPIDGSTGNDRLSTISFKLVSPTFTITLSTINLVANSIALITDGIFTTEAAGTIDNTDPYNVVITATLIHAYAPLTLVNVSATALNTNNDTPVIGTTTWSFMVDDTIQTFNTYIMRGFQRVFRVAG